jgi:hypothetical protein
MNSFKTSALEWIEAAKMARRNAHNHRWMARQWPADAASYINSAAAAYQRAHDYIAYARMLLNREEDSHAR